MLRSLILSTFILCGAATVQTVRGQAGEKPAEAAPAPVPREVSMRAVIFEDKNGDGRRDVGEPGLPDLSVSDGVEWKKTADDGSFEFTLNEAVTATVFVCTPAGWRSSRHFHLAADFDAFAGKTQKGEIGLVRDPARDAERFNFVQVTDTHVTEADQTYATMVADLEVINRFTETPAFVVATGDLVNTGKKAGEMVNYAKAVQAARQPYYNVIGNHDYGGGPLSDTENYERHLGPRYFSFSLGKYHFVARDSMADGKDPKAARRQERWIEEDIRLNAVDKRIVVFQHFLPTNKELEWWSRYNTAAIFSGHWHGRHERSYKGILDVNSPPLRFGGIDRSPRGFRVIRVDGDKLTCEMRVGQQDRRVEIIQPAAGEEAGADRVRIQVLAYDTAVQVEQVDYRIDLAGSAQPLTGKLSPNGRWMWTGTANVPLGLSNYAARLTAEVSAADGSTWTAETAFRVGGRPFPAPRMGEPWRFFHGDAGHRGYVTAGPKPPLSLAWATNLGGTVLLASPVIADDRVYAGTGFGESLDDCAVHALDLATGRVIWRSPVDSSIQHSLAAWGDNVLAVSQAAKLYCFNRDGEPRWEASLAHEESHRWELGFPVTDGKVVYAGRCAGFGAYRLEDGKPVWRKEGGRDWWPSVYSGPSIGTGLVYQGGAFVRALNPASGDIVWNLPKTVVSTVAVVPAVVERNETGDKLYVFQNGGTLLCLDGKNGETIWEASHETNGKKAAVPLGNETGTPAVGEAIVCVGGGQVDWPGEDKPSAAMHGFDKQTGKLLWRYPVSAGVVSSIPYQRGESTVTGSPVIVGGVVYFGASDGYLYALDVAGGKLLWRYRFGVPIASTVAVSGNTLVVAAWDGTVYAFTGATEDGDRK